MYGYITSFLLKMLFCKILKMMKNKLLYACWAAMTLLASCGGGSAIDDQVRALLLSGDTTQVSYDALCQQIKNDPQKFSDFIADGEVNAQAIAERVVAVGGSLRPARHWNVLQYAQAELSLSVYLERSGSMVPYDNRAGAGELKKVVNDLLNHFPAAESQKRIFIVNDDVYAYEGDATKFIQEKDIYAATSGVGNAAFTDFALILGKILERQQPGEVSVLVSDLIYSPRDTKNVNVEKIFNEENSLATQVFRKYPNKGVIVNQYLGDYIGTYYCYNGSTLQYRGKRPFYALIIADLDVIQRLASHKALGVGNACQSFRFNQNASGIDYCVIPGWTADRGRYRVKRDEERHSIEKCEADASGCLSFSVAANLAPLGKSEAFLCDSTNYSLTAQGSYTLSIKAIEPGYDNRYKSCLDGKTHIITITGTMQSSIDDMAIAIRNDFPQWIVEASAESDLSAAQPSFANTTLGVAHFLRGIYDAQQKAGAPLATLTLKLEK